MSGAAIDAPGGIAANVFLVLVWSVLAGEYAHLALTRRVTYPLFRLVSLCAALFAVHFGGHLLLQTLPADAAPWAPGARSAIDLVVEFALIATPPVVRHIVPLVPLHPQMPGRSWLAVNYGIAALVAALAVAVWISAPGEAPPQAVSLVFGAYTVVMLGLTLREAYRLRRRGTWRQGPLVIEFRSPDVAVLGIAVTASIVLFGIIGRGRGVDLASYGNLAVHTAIGLAFAVPFAVRMLGRVVRDVLVLGALLISAVAVHEATQELAARAAADGPSVAGLVRLAGLGALALIFGPGQAALRRAVDWLVFRRGHRRQAELQAIAARLDPATGVAACCAFALEELRRSMRFRGAAIALSGGRGSFATPGLAVEEVVRTAGAARDELELPDAPVMEIELRAVPSPLRDALIEAGVARIFPIASPRRRWGHLLAAENLLAAPFNDGDVAAVSGFLAQLALALDAAELLERAVAVERALAHREKLAAIGELAARVAHEIRNPVTAARSLAQLLVRDAASPHREEHELILSQLERIEHQVAALLRFARRDELRQARVDLAALVRETIRELRPALDDVGIAVQLELADGVVAEVDAEKLRQVVVNLVENARDALQDVGRERRLDVELDRRNGSARLTIADNGPGFDEGSGERLFEPFFSQKAHGTGLGLAIVRRTVELHGGTISAARAPSGGASFTIDLPLRGDA